MEKPSIIRREYVCRLCGAVRRALAHYVPRSSEPPVCCERPMCILTYEQAEAGARMSDAERATWLASGGKVVRRGGKRTWRAVK